MITIALLVIGIVGFVKKRINVTGKRELRGGGMYAVATLFCLPLPLSSLVGLGYAFSGGTAVDLRIVNAIIWAPILVAFILAFVLAQPKLPPGQPPPQPRGFEVKM